MKLYEFNCKDYSIISHLSFKDITFQTNPITSNIDSVIFEFYSESYKFEVGKSYENIFNIIPYKIKIKGIYKKFNGNFYINFQYEIDGKDSSVFIKLWNS